MPRPRRLAALALLLAACDLFPNQGDGGATPDGGNTFGYGRPTLEVTIGAAHFGPSAPDPGSRADYANTRDSFTGRVTGSTFQVQASSVASGASCAVAVRRSGDGVDPIRVGAYQVVASSFGATPDGAVSVVGNQGVAVPQGAWQCSGSGCGGAVFSLVALDATHAEGFFSGTLANTAGAGAASVTCSFYLPIATFNP